MNLNFIKTQVCPICGCTEVVYESVDTSSFTGRTTIREHVNGGRWERRKFLCGLIVAYTPNFRNEEIFGECENDPEVIERKKKLKEDKEKIREYINENNISAEVINSLSIEW